jgi:integrase
MAHIQKRSGALRDTYRVAFRVDGRQRSATFETAAHAQRFADLVDRYGGADALALTEAKAASSNAPTVAEVARAHVANLHGEITPGTAHDYESIIARRLETQPLGALPVDLVAREHVTAWLAYLEDEGLSSKTRRNHHALISAVLSYAVEEKLRPDNPARGIRIKRSEAVRAGVYLTAGELAVLVSAIPDHYQPLVITLAGTGLRWGEATSLQPGDVDLDQPTPLLRVTRAWKRTGLGHSTTPGPPKTSAGLRTIGLPPEVAETLRPLLEGRRSDDLLFLTPAGKAVRHDKFHANIWTPTLDRLSADKDAEGEAIVPALTKRPRIHDLRHAHASQLVAAGVPLNVVQKRLGHESIKTTADTYGHLAPDYLEVSAAAASLLLRQAVPLAIEG